MSMDLLGGPKPPERPVLADQTQVASQPPPLAKQTHALKPAPLTAAGRRGSQAPTFSKRRPITRARARQAAVKGVSISARI